MYPFLQIYKPGRPPGRGHSDLPVAYPNRTSRDTLQRDAKKGGLYPTPPTLRRREFRAISSIRSGTRHIHSPHGKGFPRDVVTISPYLQDGMVPYQEELPNWVPGGHYQNSRAVT